jgi:hypothetical protein
MDLVASRHLPRDISIVSASEFRVRDPLIIRRLLLHLVNVLAMPFDQPSRGTLQLPDLRCLCTLSLFHVVQETLNF